MTTEAVREMAEELPEYQSSRGAEFRTLDVEDRLDLASILVISRVQASNYPPDPDRSDAYEYIMDRNREIYYHEAGNLGIDLAEARTIWSGVVESEMR